MDIDVPTMMLVAAAGRRPLLDTALMFARRSWKKQHFHDLLLRLSESGNFEAVSTLLGYSDIEWGGREVLCKILVIQSVVCAPACSEYNWPLVDRIDQCVVMNTVVYGNSPAAIEIPGCHVHTRTLSCIRIIEMVQSRAPEPMHAALRDIVVRTQARPATDNVT